MSNERNRKKEKAYQTLGATSSADKRMDRQKNRRKTFEQHCRK
jgi:hypothetical protein